MALAAVPNSDSKDKFHLQRRALESPEQGVHLFARSPTPGKQKIKTYKTVHFGKHGQTHVSQKVILKKKWNGGYKPVYKSTTVSKKKHGSSAIKVKHYSKVYKGKGKGSSTKKIRYRSPGYKGKSSSSLKIKHHSKSHKGGYHPGSHQVKYQTKTFKSKYHPKNGSKMVKYHSKDVWLPMATTF
ncbi:hypothetical protein BDEG_28317 [Batrachochytrium dendrobatidis JEL423]|uniref:Uncharacterized protein n=1 Tax=Batrachochytrium dendrobatidis (strain JEL423) TaxID=403673 RepID=A0A177WYW6_BATDL|nr:hypothetical protein BDEG_28317 [Batrachochytrium dendrobatidis JEL423]